jgi:hypothetical protein
MERLSPNHEASTTGAQLWAVRVFDHARLPDRRLKQRGASTLAAMAARPEASLPQACERWATTKGTYRFLSNERVEFAALERAFAAETASRCEACGVLVLPQDTTYLNLPGPPEDVVGPAGGHGVPGALCHSTLAVTPEGRVLGLLDQQVWVRDWNERTKHKRKQRPIEAKESRKWLTGMAGARHALAEAGAKGRVIHVMDREGDIYEVFAAIREAGEGAVIRLVQPRRVDDNGTLRSCGAAIARTRPLGRVAFERPRQPGKKARTVTMEVRAQTQTLAPVSKARQRPRLRLNLLELQEVDAPDDEAPLQWRLWTTEDVKGLEQARRVIDYYRLRWRTEEFHYTLKSGCRIERLRLEALQRLRKAIVMYSAVAARIVELRDYARVAPQAPCTVVLSRLEWRTLHVLIHQQRCPHDQQPPSLRQATLWIGRLGGHLNRKGDGMPGVKTLWLGWQELMTAVRVTSVFDTA